MYDSFEVSSVLVIAPLRVATQTWPDEIEKWEHLHDLTYAVAVGTEAAVSYTHLYKAPGSFRHHSFVPSSVQTL